jgi:hypothetical protein
MDPNATLRRWRQAVKDRDFDDASEAKKDLQAWIRRGGFPPSIPMTPREKSVLGIKARSNPLHASTLLADKIRLDRGGYDRGGRYWGVGLPLFRVYSMDGEVDVHVRANTASQAKKLAHKNPCAPRANPNFHYPRTARGRPKKAVAWNIGYYDRDNRMLGRSKLSTNRADAHETAKNAIGAKIGRGIVHRAVLTGPK